MKTLLIPFVILCFSLTGAAQELSKSFSEMTYEELQQIDTNALERNEKKQFKKAFTKAKRVFEKAERARIKAEKRAERKRRKAEKARLKAEAKKAREEAKRIAKQNKEINKQLAAIDASYQAAYIVKDEFETFVRIVGKTHNPLSWFSTEPYEINYFLRSFYRPEKPSLTAQAYITVTSQYSVNQAALEESGLSLAKYGQRKNLYYDYSRAALRGGKLLPINLIRKYAFDYCSNYCSFKVDYAIDIDIRDIIKVATEGGSLDIKISSVSAPNIIVSFPNDYMTGYFLRIAEVDSELAPFSNFAKEKITFIKAQLKPKKNSGKN